MSSEKRLLFLVRSDGSILAHKCDPAVAALKFGQVCGWRAVSAI